MHPVWTLMLVLSAVASLNACVPILAGGMVTSALVIADRRSSGTMLEDQETAIRIGNRINAKFGDDAHVNVTSFNHIVLLTGEVRNDEMRKVVETIARDAGNVRNVINETAILPFSAVADRANDTYLADKVRARYVTDGHFQPSVVNTIVERQEVFLMGLVTPAEGEEAARVASNTTGVVRVVKLFEYLDPTKMPPAPAAPNSVAGSTEKSAPAAK
jgi:osmotically-inducible protein OsmY